MQTIKADVIRNKQPSTLEEARKFVTAFGEHYNNNRLHTAIGFIAPADVLAVAKSARGS